MKKVITYGTYDLLHFGHIRLLERAKELGDYLIVGVTADGFDRARGKINVQQSLMQRIEAVKATGIADEIIVEEYEGQKIDDIKRYNVDIFTVGSDWRGTFDYLGEFCQVVYLDRTQGISSTELRSVNSDLKVGLLGESPILNKFEAESHFVNGMTVSGICTSDVSRLSPAIQSLPCVTDDYQKLLDVSDAVFVISTPREHYAHIRQALLAGKHVLCESPITTNVSEWEELFALAEEKGLVLMDSIKTAYSMAYYRMLLLAISGAIGEVKSVDATCTSLYNFEMKGKTPLPSLWNSISAWGPTALLPIFQLLGSNYVSKTIVTHLLDEESDFDTFTKISFIYPSAVASLKVGQGVKSEGELVISGTKGYIYVPAPWWKTDYFEVRFENPAENKRYFYQLDGEGIRFELLSFLSAVRTQTPTIYMSPQISKDIVQMMEDFHQRKDTVLI